MSVEKLKTVTTSMFLGLSIFNGAYALNNGVTALEHDNEAAKAEETAQTLEAQGNPQAV